MVAFTDAGADKLAVVVKGSNAFVAIFAMMRPEGWIDSAGRTIASSSSFVGRGFRKVALLAAVIDYL